MNANKFTTFSKVIDGVEITFTSQYYGRTTETRFPKLINVYCSCHLGGLRTGIARSYNEAMQSARELAQLEIAGK